MKKSAEMNEMFKKCKEMVESLGYSVPYCNVYVDGRLKRALGNCRRDYKGYTIKISEHYLNACKEKDKMLYIEQTMIHEIIHTLPGNMNHGAGFQRVAKEVNAKFGYHIQTKSTISYDVSAEISKHKAQYKYLLFCPHCHRSKRYKNLTWKVEHANRYNCRYCGSSLSYKTI